MSDQDRNSELRTPLLEDDGAGEMLSDEKRFPPTTKSITTESEEGFVSEEQGQVKDDEKVPLLEDISSSSDDMADTSSKKSDQKHSQDKALDLENPTSSNEPLQSSPQPKTAEEIKKEAEAKDKTQNLGNPTGSSAPPQSSPQPKTAEEIEKEAKAIFLTEIYDQNKGFSSFNRLMLYAFLNNKEAVEDFLHEMRFDPTKATQEYTARALIHTKGSPWTEEQLEIYKILLAEERKKYLQNAAGGIFCAGGIGIVVLTASAFVAPDKTLQGLKDTANFLEDKLSPDLPIPGAVIVAVAALLLLLTYMALRQVKSFKTEKLSPDSLAEINKCLYSELNLLAQKILEIQDKRPEVANKLKERHAELYKQITGHERDELYFLSLGNLKSIEEKMDSMVIVIDTLKSDLKTSDNSIAKLQEPLRKLEVLQQQESKLLEDLEKNRTLDKKRTPMVADLADDIESRKKQILNIKAEIKGLEDLSKPSRDKLRKLEEVDLPKLKIFYNDCCKSFKSRVGGDSPELGFFTRKLPTDEIKNNRAKDEVKNDRTKDDGEKNEVKEVKNDRTKDDLTLPRVISSAFFKVLQKGVEGKEDAKALLEQAKNDLLSDVHKPVVGRRNSMG